MSDRREHFPATERTWLHDAIADGRRGEVSHFVMKVYAEPLAIYCAATSFRSLGDPKDLVAGFFASRLDDPAWIESWAETNESQGIRLSRWLMNGLNFFLHEEARRRQRDGRVSTDAAVALSAAPDAAMRAEQAFDRSLALAIVREAIERASAACAAAGQSAHFEIFMQHHGHGRPYDSFAASHGVDPAQCAGMARTAAAKFRKALAEIIAREYAGRHLPELDETLAELAGRLGA